MRKNVHEASDRGARILSIVPWFGRPAKKELRDRLQMQHIFFDIYQQPALNREEGQPLIDSRTGLAILAVDWHSNDIQQRKLHELRTKAEQDPNYRQIITLADYVHRNSVTSPALAELRDASMNAYRMSLLGAAAKTIKDDYHNYHIASGTGKTLARGFSAVQDIHAIASLGTTVIAERILKRMLEHAVVHAAQRFGIRRVIDAIILPKVLDNGRWVYVENQDGIMRKALQQAQEDLKRHHPGLADQLVDDRGPVARLVNFKGNQVNEEQLVQFMEAVYYLMPFEGPVVQNRGKRGGYIQLPGFKDNNRSIAQYDFYIEEIKRDIASKGQGREQGRPPLPRQKRRRRH